MLRLNCEQLCHLSTATAAAAAAYDECRPLKLYNGTSLLEQIRIRKKTFFIQFL